MKSAHSSKPRWRRLRRLAAVAAVVLVLYAGAYFRLSRRGMAEARAAGWTYFLYCPLSDLTPGEELPRQHLLLLRLFSPINEIDQAYFGGGSPCIDILWSMGR